MYKSFSGIKQSIPIEISKLSHLPRPVKWTALSLTLGIALIGTLAMFFRKRRKRTQMIQKKLEAKNQQRKQNTSANHAESNHVNKAQSSGGASALNRSTLSFRKLRSSHLTKTQTPNGGELFFLLLYLM